MLYKIAKEKKDNGKTARSMAAADVVAASTLPIAGMMLGAGYGYNKNHALVGLMGPSAVNGAVAKDTGKSTLTDTILGGIIGGAAIGAIRGGMGGAIDGSLIGGAGTALGYGAGHLLGSNQSRLYRKAKKRKK
jgi:hypothetical protein